MTSGTKGFSISEYKNGKNVSIDGTLSKLQLPFDISVIFVWFTLSLGVDSNCTAASESKEWAKQSPILVPLLGSHLLNLIFYLEGEHEAERENETRDKDGR